MISEYFQIRDKIILLVKIEFLIYKVITNLLSTTISSVRFLLPLLYTYTFMHQILTFPLFFLYLTRHLTEIYIAM